MALIKCKECGKEISSMSEVCPNCGSKTRYGKEQKDAKSKTIGLYAGLALLFVGALLFIPSFVTLIENMNDWYFWNWSTSYSNSIVTKTAVGGGLIAAGAVLFFSNVAESKK